MIEQEVTDPGGNQDLNKEGAGSTRRIVDLNRR
jgi:hypothetical protein